MKVLRGTIGKLLKKFGEDKWKIVDPLIMMKVIYETFDKVSPLLKGIEKIKMNKIKKNIKDKNYQEILEYLSEVFLE